MRTTLLVISILILVPLTDASKIYHFIRGQDTIKLYVIFNALEVYITYFSLLVYVMLRRETRLQIDFVRRSGRTSSTVYFRGPLLSFCPTECR